MDVFVIEQKVRGSNLSWNTILYKLFRYLYGHPESETAIHKTNYYAYIGDI
jgi:hypothetical protein